MQDETTYAQQKRIAKVWVEFRMCLCADLGMEPSAREKKMTTTTMIESATIMEDAQFDISLTSMQLERASQ
jgi:hypothetical protein